VDSSREVRLKTGLNAISAAEAIKKEGNMRPRKNQMKRKAQDSSNTLKRIEKWRDMR